MVDRKTVSDLLASPECLVNTIASLEACIGKTPAPAKLKVIDHLDENALRWLSFSPLIIAAFGAETGVHITLGGGGAGFLKGDKRYLTFPAALLDDPSLATAGMGFGSLSLLPGVRETLRINGRVEDIQDGTIKVLVQECYIHCAKAFIRSGFWEAAPQGFIPSEPADLVRQSSFMLLATSDADGQTDVSPKGDPQGGLAQLIGDNIWFADRPGNRRADSFRNILTQPRIACALLVPGCEAVVYIEGRAHMTTDADACARFIVQDKIPKLVTCISEPDIRLCRSGALARAALWPAGACAEDINVAQMVLTHVKLNKSKGLGAKLTGSLLSIPGLVQKSLDKDYKTNLY